MKTLLSTRIISDRQKKLICDKQIKLIDKDFISISKTVFDIANKCINWIFTSKNAVNMVLQSESKRLINFDEIHTVTLYLNKSKQQEYYEYIISLNPKRVIFNPGTENEEFRKILNNNSIKHLNACTLVLLSTNQY